MSILTIPMLLLGLHAGGTSAPSVRSEAVGPTATAESRPMNQDEARAFVEEISVPTRGRLVRFVQPVCVGVEGLRSDLSRAVAERIRSVARLAGASVAAANCAPQTLVVIVSPDGLRDVTRLMETRPFLFSRLSRTQKADLLQPDQKVRAWHLTAAASSDGIEAGEIVSPGNEGTSGNSGGLGLPAVPRMNVNSASIINPSSQQILDGSIIVLDAKAILGLSLTQIGDYGAMRGLASTRTPAGTAGSPTILSLFDASRNRLPELSGADLLYLKALYSGANNQRLGAQKQRIVKALTAPR